VAALAFDALRLGTHSQELLPVPELPDVEHFKDIFENAAFGKTVAKAVPIRHKGRLFRVLRNATENELRRAVEGQRFLEGERIGKFLAAYLSNGFTLVFHFMLSGRLVLTAYGQRLDPALTPYASLQLQFSDGSSLWFVDRRNLGKVFLTRNRDFARLGVLAKMGVDPTSAAFTLELFRRIVAGSGDRLVKQVLTDQRKVAGLGNVLSDLALYIAGVRPTRPASSLSPEEVSRLFGAVRESVDRGIAQYHGGDDEFLRERHKGGRCPRHPKVSLEAIVWGASHAYYCPVEQE